ncbi:MAG: ferredoxin reductase family protein [Egibacteraceae bacterium]
MSPATDTPLVFTRQGLRGPAWFAVLLPGLVAVLLWMAAPNAGTAFATPAGALRQLALLAGLCGYAAFATDLVIGARLPALERLFSSLDRMYRFHRGLGAAVGGLLLTHALFMAGSYAVTPGLGAATLLRPDPGWRVFSGVIAFVLLVTVLAVSRFVRLPHETFLRVHRLFGVVFALGALHALRVPGAALPALDAYLLLLTVAGVTGWLYRSGLGRTLVKRHFYRVLTVRPLHPSVVEVALTPVEEPLRFTPGQLVFVGIDDDAVTRELHPFSITSAAGERELRLVVKAVGDFTTSLPGVAAGAWARVEGPYGGFWHNGRGIRRQVWIAGGIGITPFLSMARSLEGDDHEIDLFYCVEDAEAAVFLDELYTLADQRPRIRIVPVRADALGFLTAEDVRSVCGDLSGVHLFLCGPPAMIETLTAQFATLGVSREHLHFEDFRLKGRAS